MLPVVTPRISVLVAIELCLKIPQLLQNLRSFQGIQEALGVRLLNGHDQIRLGTFQVI